MQKLLVLTLLFSGLMLNANEDHHGDHHHGDHHGDNNPGHIHEGECQEGWANQNEGDGSWIAQNEECQEGEWVADQNEGENIAYSNVVEEVAQDIIANDQTPDGQQPDEQCEVIVGPTKPDKKNERAEKLYNSLVKKCIIFAAHRTGDLTALQSLLGFCRNYRKIVRSLIDKEQQEFLLNNEAAYEKLVAFAEKIITQIQKSKADTAVKGAYAVKIEQLLSEIAQAQRDLPEFVKKTVEIISSDIQIQ